MQWTIHIATWMLRMLVLGIVVPSFPFQSHFALRVKFLIWWFDGSANLNLSSFAYSIWLPNWPKDVQTCWTAHFRVCSQHSLQEASYTFGAHWLNVYTHVWRPLMFGNRFPSMPFSSIAVVFLWNWTVFTLLDVLLLSIASLKESSSAKDCFLTFWILF